MLKKKIYFVLVLIFVIFLGILNSNMNNKRNLLDKEPSYILTSEQLNKEKYQHIINNDNFDWYDKYKNNIIEVSGIVTQLPIRYKEHIYYMVIQTTDKDDTYLWFVVNKKEDIPQVSLGDDISAKGIFSNLVPIMNQHISLIDAVVSQARNKNLKPIKGTLPKFVWEIDDIDEQEIVIAGKILHIETSPWTKEWNITLGDKRSSINKTTIKVIFEKDITANEFAYLQTLQKNAKFLVLSGKYMKNDNRLLNAKIINPESI